MSDGIKQPRDKSIQLEERTSVKDGQETKTDPQEDERIDVGGICQTDGTA